MTEPRVAFLGQFFPPEAGAPEISYGIARAIQDAGFNVRVVTGVPNYPTGRVQAGYRAWARSTEVVRGIPTLRVPLYPNHTLSPLGRFANYASFAASATVFGHELLSSADVNFVISSPATNDMIGLLYKRTCGVPCVLSVQDLWPDSIFATGFLGDAAGSHVETFLRWLTDRSYRGADRVLVISDGMKEALVRRGVHGEKIEVMYNWVDERVFQPEGGVSDVRKALAIPDDHFVFMYSGNLGSAQALELWVEAFAGDMTPANTHLVLLGDGNRRAELLRLAGGSCRIHFLPHLDDLEAVVANMRAADALVVSLRDHPLFGITLPSKVVGALALGKAVLATVPGDAAKVLDRSGAGVVGQPGSVTSVANVVGLAVSEGRAALAARGALGRKYYEANMSRAKGQAQLRRVMESVLADRGGASSGGRH